MTAVHQLVKAGGAEKLASEADWGRVRGMLERALESMDSRHLAGTHGYPCPAISCLLLVR